MLAGFQLERSPYLPSHRHELADTRGRQPGSDTRGCNRNSRGAKQNEPSFTRVPFWYNFSSNLKHCWNFSSASTTA
jgi:hypothetical protein